MGSLRMEGSDLAQTSTRGVCKMDCAVEMIVDQQMTVYCLLVHFKEEE